MAAAENSQLGTYQKHIDDMRSLIHCKICLKPFYEPFTLTCGHTYCYSCLSGWLNGPHNKGEDKNCPDCRHRISAEPSPNFTLRDLVHMFCNRVELLPEDETTFEHEQGKAAEAKVLADDKRGLGLFKGRFKRRRPVYGLARALRDVTDGVDRCPECMWELEDGTCNQCGYAQHSDFSDDDSEGSLEDHMANLDDYDSEDDDRDISPVDQFGGPVDIPVLRRHVLAGYGSDYADDVGGQPGTPHYYSLDEAEHESEMDDFIDDDDYPEEVDHDDNGSGHTVDTYNTTSPAAQYSTDNAGVATDYDDEDDEGPVPSHRPVHGRRQVPIEIDAGEDTGSESETTTQATIYDNDTASEARTVDGDNETSESDDSSLQEVTPPPAFARARKRRVVESEDEEESAEESSESDDTAVRAPQPTAARRQRLSARRASNTLQAARRRSPSPPPQQSASSGSWARRGRGNGTVPRRVQPYTRVH